MNRALRPPITPPGSRAPGRALRRHRGLAIPAILAVASVAGCAGEDAAAPGAAPPPGAVLLVEGLPLLAPEVAPLSADIRELYPEYSEVHARRLALTNEFLPRLAARAQEPEGWRRARTACAEAGEPFDGLAIRVEEGTFHSLGVALWSAARHLPVGTWSPPVELTGRWLRLRLEERVERPDPREERLRISLVDFPFLAPEAFRERVDAAVDAARLQLVDPAFCEAVPEAWKHRMRASEP
jgi:hypothetical protein